MGTAERREREKQQRVDAILDAALEVFAEKGLKNATMEDVAEKAELSKGTIYLYFKSKEHMFFAIDMRAGEILHERFSEASRSADSGLAKVKAIGRAYYQFCFDYPNFFKAMSYVESMDPHTFKEIAQEMTGGNLQSFKNSSLAVLAEAVEMGHKDGSIAEDMHPWVMAVLLWSTSNGVIGMIKNRGDYLKLFDLPVDALYPAKELLIERGMAPLMKKSESDETK